MTRKEVSCRKNLLKTAAICGIMLIGVGVVIRPVERLQYVTTNTAEIAEWSADTLEWGASDVED